MDDYNDYSVPTTRVWWEDREVAFVRWTDQALVFAWRESDETAMHIPRGAVLRLLDRGVLRIDGDAPAWLYDSRPLQLRRPERPAPAPKKAAPKAAPQKDRGRFNIIARPRVPAQRLSEDLRALEAELLAALGMPAAEG